MSSLVLMFWSATGASDASDASDAIDATDGLVAKRVPGGVVGVPGESVVPEGADAAGWFTVRV